MIKFNIDETNALVHIQPEASLSEGDFKLLTAEVDRFIDKRGYLAGIIIEADKFPGWENFSGFVAHLKFVKNHHEAVKKVALVTDTKLANLAEALVSHFVVAEIKHFPAGSFEAAKKWLVNK